ncbi:MAG: hypothetical protein WDO24_06885 [Pseudomonadota bacterium]
MARRSRLLQAAGILLLLSAVLAQHAAARTPEEQHAIAVLITHCTEDHRQFFASGLTRDQYLLFCNCYVFSAIDAIDDDEQTYRRSHDGPSPKFVEITRALVGRCIEEVRDRLPD